MSANNQKITTISFEKKRRWSETFTGSGQPQSIIAYEKKSGHIVSLEQTKLCQNLSSLKLILRNDSTTKNMNSSYLIDPKKDLLEEKKELLEEKRRGNVKGYQVWNPLWSRGWLPLVTCPIRDRWSENTNSNSSSNCSSEIQFWSSSIHDYYHGR